MPPMIVTGKEREKGVSVASTVTSTVPEAFLFPYNRPFLWALLVEREVKAKLASSSWTVAVITLTPHPGLSRARRWHSMEKVLWPSLLSVPTSSDPSPF